MKNYYGRKIVVKLYINISNYLNFIKLRKYNYIVDWRNTETHKATDFPSHTHTETTTHSIHMHTKDITRRQCLLLERVKIQQE